MSGQHWASMAEMMVLMLGAVTALGRLTEGLSHVRCYTKHWAHDILPPPPIVALLECHR